MSRKWLVLWKDNRRLGSVELTVGNLQSLKNEFHMSLIQRDETGTGNWQVWAPRKRKRK